MRTRNKLHKTKLQEFIRFAKSLGFSQEICKGEYEVVRLRGKEGLAIIHQRLGDRGDHFTTHGLSTDLINKFLQSS